MQPLSILLSLLIMTTIAGLASLVTRAPAPDQEYTPYLVALIVTSAVIGASTFLSGIVGTSQLIDDLFS